MAMKAIRVEQFGPEENLKITSGLPIPTPADDEVLIRVKAAGINPVDTYIRSGQFPLFDKTPYTPGLDGAGIVEKVGKGVTDFKHGDRVIFVMSNGALAEYCTARAAHVCQLHESLSFVQGASVGIPYYSAYDAAINKARTQPGETVLIHGASGAVGIGAIQILKAHGCTIMGTAGTPEGIKMIKELGVDKAYNHREEGYMKKIKDDIGGNGVNVIIEMLADVNTQADLDLIANRGRIVIVGCRGSTQVDFRALMMNAGSIHSIILFSVTDEEYKDIHKALWKGQQLGWLKPKVGKAYKMEEAAQGHRDVIYNKGTMGKLVIDMEI